MLNLYQEQTYPFELPELPYAYNSLEPVIDQQTMRIHHDKHHSGYVKKLNAALENHRDLQDNSLAELLLEIDLLPQEVRQGIINSGGGHANHALFWHTLQAPTEPNNPTGEIKNVIENVFGSFNDFKEKFNEAATSQFGSGWAWLAVDQDGDNLHVSNSPNQNSPLMESHIPLLGIDVWEHAYYLKYQNKRAEYVESFWKIVNWDMVEELYQATRKN